MKSHTSMYEGFTEDLERVTQAMRKEGPNLSGQAAFLVALATNINQALLSYIKEQID